MQQVLCLAKVIISYFFSGLVYFLLNEIQIKNKNKTYAQNESMKLFRNVSVSRYAIFSPICSTRSLYICIFKCLESIKLLLKCHFRYVKCMLSAKNLDL